MPKQMPGYKANQEKLEVARKATEAMRVAREKFVEERRQSAKKEAEQEILHKKKLKAIKKIENKDNPIFKRFLKNFFIGQMGLFVMGSAAFLIGPEQGNDVYDDWARLTYWDAFKSAYGMNSKHNVADNTVYYTLFFTAIILCISIIKPKIENDEEAKRYLSQLEQLKQFGIDIKNMVGDLQPIYNKMLASLSEIDRGYFDNLAKGGLDTENYETCIAIVSGYLKSHPKEYNQVIAIIDEATLPPEIVKKYGKGKTISFAAAQAMQFEK